MESLNNVVVNDSTESSDLLSYSMVTDAGFVFFDLKKDLKGDWGRGRGRGAGGMGVVVVVSAYIVVSAYSFSFSATVTASPIPTIPIGFKVYVSGG